MGPPTADAGFDIPGKEPAFYEVPWIRRLILGCAGLIVLAGCYEAGVRIQQYGAKKVVVEGEKMALYAELKNKPAWLDKVILDRIIGQTEEFAARDTQTYKRLANPLDKEILREVAENYTKVDEKGNHAAMRENAWIKQITQVRRVVDRVRKTQTIEIYAEYRKPAAWVISGGKCYLVDGEFVRLPVEYSSADRKVTTGLMAITGLESTKVPEAGASWSGEDLAAGMKMVELLANEKWAVQVDAIDVSNFQGRKDAMGPWVVLNTVWPKADGTPRVVMWGRTLGEEKFYDVSAASKLKTINEIYLKFSRIDAGRDYVDVHGDQPKVPKVAVQEDSAAGVRQRG